jgi:MinD superfamily P-loop ATPase
MTRTLGLSFGVVINRSDIGDEAVRRYCAAEAVPLLMEIPEDRHLAEAYSRGEPAVLALPRWRELFQELGQRLLAAAARSARQVTAAGRSG